jgi:hypothetical protein
VNQEVARPGPCPLELPAALRLGGAGLQDERFPQRVLAGDEVLVAAVEPFKEPQFGNPGELAARAIVAVRAGQDEVPDAVDVQDDARTAA